MQCSSADRIESDLRQEWVELTPFELRRLCADCREKKTRGSARLSPETRQFKPILGEKAQLFVI